MGRIERTIAGAGDEGLPAKVQDSVAVLTLAWGTASELFGLIFDHSVQ
jgi:hypothetical protein